MIPDVMLAPGQWHDLYAEAELSPGTPLLIANKGPTVVYVWEGAAPPPRLTDGMPCFSDPQIADQAGVSGCWVASLSSIELCVQVYSA